MNKNEKRNNGLIQSQKLLSSKIEKVNRLFLIHFSTLILFFLFATTNLIIWISSLITGQVTTAIAQRYGLFGTIVTILETVLLIIFVFQIGIQLSLYGAFIIRGNRLINRNRSKKGDNSQIFDAIIPYINNFYAFFNRYSKEKTNLSKLVSLFLGFNFISGIFVTILFATLLDVENANLTIAIIFLLMVTFWIASFITSLKIRNEIVKWENLFPKLEEWAQELEN